MDNVISIKIPVIQIDQFAKIIAWKQNQNCVPLGGQNKSCKNETMKSAEKNGIAHLLI